MKALCWHGTEDVRVETVPDPLIVDTRDVIVKITSTAICGSDLHLYNGLMPTMEPGDVLGHEPMGEVVEVGSGITTGVLDKIPFGAAMNKGLTLKMGQTNVPRYHHQLLAKIEAGQIDPSFVITHRLPLEEAPEAYRTFRDKKDGCIKVVLTP